MRIEILPLVVNIGCTLYYVCWSRPFEPGKVLYWIGATLLTVGLLKMRG